ncbi:MAG: glycoside hydrolase family 13 protein [Christensenellales bacterium]|nr:glycoside hydrolase family 13 protein [Christensenellales bacterium]
MFYHNSRNSLYRSPSGAVPSSSTLTIRIRADKVRSVTLRIWWANGEKLVPMVWDNQDTYVCQLHIPDAIGVLWYYFCIVNNEGVTSYYGNADDGLGGIGALRSTPPPSYQITIYDPQYHTPNWMRNGNMMQIMVDRFHASKKPDPRNLPLNNFYHADWYSDPILVINDRTGDYSANDFFGGDLKGIEEKLDYISDMGITVLYLNPIFKANSNHKYNTGDYMQIDPTFGTEEDFRRLCQKAEARGIRVVLDGVFNHTGSDSIYFNRNKNYGDGGAFNDPASPYSSWYSFSNWPNRYDSWWGFQTLPNVNEMEPSFRNFIINNKDSVTKHWLKAGASGWRLDVADELPMDFIREMRSELRRIYPDAAIIGEVWEDPSNKVAYGEHRCYCIGDTLDSTMNYPLRDAVLQFLLGKIEASNFVRRIQFMYETQPKEFFYSQMNLLSSHDKPRALSVLAELGNMEPERQYRRAFDIDKEKYALGKRRLIAAWNLICALPGMPCMYYGDEAGLYGMSDPFCRGTYPWGKEDQELVQAFKTPLIYRKNNAVLRTGAMRVMASGPDVIIVWREITGNTDIFGDPAQNGMVTFAINRANEPRTIEYNEKDVQVPAQNVLWLMN